MKNKKMNYHFWSDNCGADFIQNNFLFHLSSLFNDKTAITWNTREAYHCHSLCDAQAGTENTLINSSLKDFDSQKDYDRDLVLKIISNTKDTTMNLPNNDQIINYFGKYNVHPIEGISDHHSFLFLGIGEAILRKLTNISGCSNKTNKKKNVMKKIDGGDTKFTWNYHIISDKKKIIHKINTDNGKKKKMKTIKLN